MTDLTNPNLNPEEVLAVLESLPDELDWALRDMDGSGFDRARAEGVWTIREIVHHIADSTAMATHAIRMAIAAPGSRYDQTWYDMSNRMTVPMAYCGRSIEPSVQLVRATLDYLAEMLRAVDRAWPKEVIICTERDPEGKAVSVSYLVRGMAWHIRHHMQQIEQTRETMNDVANGPHGTRVGEG